MRFNTDRRSGLDPLFGLPVTRESRAMDSARDRNFRSDKRLEVSLKTIDHTMHTKVLRHQTLVAKTKDFLETINPNPEKRVVCPFGLSSDEKQTIRLLRRGSVPSMTLHEFDQKLSSVRASRGTANLSDTAEPERNDKCKFSEFRLKRKLYSRNSKKYSQQQSNLPAELNVVDATSQSTLNPLYRCKTLVGSAYQRLTSADTKNQLVRFETIHDLERDNKPYKGRGSQQMSSPSTGYRFGRRNTVSELKSAGGSSTPSSESSQPDEERYERFLTVLKKDAILPELIT